MKAMQCDQATELIGAYLDHELDADTRREIATHLKGCPVCAALADDVQSMSGQLAALGREGVPEKFADRLRLSLADATREISAPVDLTVSVNRPRRAWLSHAAVLVLACGLAAGGTALVMSRLDAGAAIARDVAAAHARALLQDSPTQIASSDSHAVKPWFAGRLEFAPAVRDLAAEGFPLAGARLDFVGERRVAALVYKRRLHMIDVFVWPSTDGTDTDPRVLVRRGYNVVTWTKGGIVYWTISDLNLPEMRLLQSLL